MISLSDRHGFFPQTVWDDPENAALKKLRPDMNVLFPGDTVTIPDLRPRLEKRPAGAKHRFQRKGVPAMFRLQVFHHNIPQANEPFTLTVDGKQQTGTTDGQGIVACFVPAQSKQGKLVVGKLPNEVNIDLDFGHLDPIGEVTGVQHRLTNLGYPCDPIDGEWNESTKQALCEFQRNHKLKVTGEFDAATKTRIETIHDEPYKYPEPTGGGA